MNKNVDFEEVNGKKLTSGVRFDRILIVIMEKRTIILINDNFL